MRGQGIHPLRAGAAIALVAGATLWSIAELARAGTFREPRLEPVEYGPEDLVPADFDGDGHKDLAVSLSSPGRIGIFRGRGDGTLRRELSTEELRGVDILRAADLDDDGDQDLVATNNTYDYVHVFLGRGDATFRKPTEYFVRQAPTNDAGIEVSDLDCDGTLDIVIARYAQGTGRGGIYTLDGRGDGTFRRTDLRRHVAPATSMTLGYFDDDRKVDLLQSAGRPKPALYVWRGSCAGKSNFADPERFRAPLAFQDLDSADFNRDGDTDVIGSHAYDDFDRNKNDLDVVFFRGERGITLDRTAAFRGSSPRPSQVLAARLDPDASSDVAVLSFGNGPGGEERSKLQVFRGRGGFEFSRPESYRVPPVGLGLVATDLTEDGRLDLASAHERTSNLALLVNSSG